MFTRDDLIDWLVELLAAQDKGRATDGEKPQGPLRRVFISDWELRRLRRPGEKTIRLPRGSIVSPLARDWIDYEGIRLIFE
ncbi:MAG TPA: hypothetical protein PLL10_01705 [Elusimicrobiales bacterium]|nr:hypothetical protein [Elusimicrobiales bacterium]